MGDYKPRVVRQGDFLDRLAFRAGESPDAVWNHAKNAELKKKRPRGDELCPGDILYLPDPQSHATSFQKGATTELTATVPKRRLSVVFEALSGPVANQPCEVRGLPGPPLKLQTGGDGSLSFDVPVTVHTADVFLPQLGHTYRLGIGDMNPLEEPSGIAQRLENLGYLAPGLRVGDAALARALRAFQHDQGLAVTGTANDATKDRLRAVAGV